MRRIIFLVGLFAALVNGQSFSVIGDSLWYEFLQTGHIISSVQIKNNTAQEITIDSIFIRILPDPDTLFMRRFSSMEEIQNFQLKITIYTYTLLMALVFTNIK